MRLVFVILISLLFAVSVRAQESSDSDESAIQSVIDGQLKAFATDNGLGAYEFAAPLVKGIFPDATTFMSMVKKGYQPVYRNKTYTFGESFQDNLGRPAQRVVITAMDGKRYEAVYSMEKQPDGTWKIAGCYLVAIQELDA